MTEPTLYPESGFLRLRLDLAYDGTNFSGWGKQPDRRTVQEEVEKAIATVTQSKIDSIVAGRTDAGVHAKQYFFHVDLENSEDLIVFVFKLNRMLPESIFIKEMKSVESDLHARFAAKKRTYRYFIHPQKDPFKEELSWYFPQKIDVDQMNKAANFLLGEKDFCSFAKVHTDVKTTICSVYSAKWHTDTNGLYFEISANRFLRNMVRAIVGTLLEVGAGKIPPEEIQTILSAKNRQEAAVSVPAHGLFLWEILY